MIKLEAFNENDFSRLISWIDSEELLVQFAGPIFSYPLTNSQLELYLDDKNRHPFKIIDKESNTIFGHAEIYLQGNNCVKLCRILIGKSDFKGKGLCTKIVTELLNISFNKLNAKVVELNVYDWNESAIRCYKKAGFVIQKEKSKTNSANGKTWTSLNMEITEKDWR